MNSPIAYEARRAHLIATLVCLIWSLTLCSAVSQGVIQYKFNGTLPWVLPGGPGGNPTPGVNVGDPVQGWFSVDYTAAAAGNYRSPNNGYSVQIGAFTFGTNPANDNWIEVGVISPGPRDCTFYANPGGGLSGLYFGTYGSGPFALPASAANFEALNAELNLDGFVWGLDIAITEVPEPEVTILSLAGGVLLLCTIHRVPRRGHGRQ